MLVEPELEREIARQIIFQLMFDANLPVMIVGDELETGILLMLKGQESASKH